MLRTAYRLVTGAIISWALLWSGTPRLCGQLAGKKGANDLVIADGGTSAATVVVAPKAGEWEARAARDLAHYIERMSGAKVPVADTDDAAAKALAGNHPVLV